MTLFAAQPGSAPTLPQLTDLGGRSGVLSALMLLEAIQVGILTPEGCAGWILESFGLAVDVIAEGRAGSVAASGPDAEGRVAALRPIAEAARREVVRTLRGLLATPQDDAFVARALYRQRVRREAQGGKSVWVPRPSPDSPLSELLLLLFVVDILGHRDSYDSRLSVCDTCGRISFVERRGVRFGCVEHPVR